MKIVLAPDKFKGCLSAAEVCAALAEGLRAVQPGVEIDSCPMADGGEGMVDALVAATGGRFEECTVTGPLPEMKVTARFGILGGGDTSTKTAVIEMAAASGIALLKDADRNPMNTTTFGTGELIRAAAELGCARIIVGLGGSATTDGGIGCAQGAGLTVLMRDGSAAPSTEPLCGRDLPEVLMIKHARGSPVDRVAITAACDVDNPLFGPRGAARIFGPQKGASESDVAQLDEWLRGLAVQCGKLEEAATAGAGAAGGLGFGLISFFGAKLRPGIELVIEATQLRRRLAGADLCITGEGRLDETSLAGKTPVGVSRVCREVGVPCVAVAGEVEIEADLLWRQGIKSAFAIREGMMSLSEAMAGAPELLSRMAGEILRLRAMR